MKKCFKFLMGLAVLFTMAACGMTVDELESEVLEVFNEDAEETGIYATDITLVDMYNNEYKGLITVTDGTEEEYWEIKVYSDGDRWWYEVVE